MKITSHATSPVNPTIHEDGTVMFSVPSYYLAPDGRRSRRQIVETGEKGERVSTTLYRALDDEISETPGSAQISLMDEKPFLVLFRPDQKHPGGVHAKFFFFVEVTGKLRSFAKKDGNEELGPMISIEAGELLAAMKSEGTVPVHFEATQAALAVLANRYEAVYYRYAKLLADCPLPAELTEAEWESVYAYPKWF